VSIGQAPGSDRQGGAAQPRPSSGIVYPFEIRRELYDWARFSDEEYARRHRLVREFMAERGLDCMVFEGSNAIWERGWANIRWLTNYIGTMELDALCIFPLEGDPTLAILGLNARLPDRMARSIVTDIRGALNTTQVLIGRLRELGLERARIGVVPVAPYLSLPADHVQALTSELPKVELVDCSDAFWRLRLVLSPEELACLEEAGRIGDAAVEAIIDELRPGMHETDLFAIIYERLAREGGELPTMVLAASESTRAPVSGFQRPRPISRQIQEGDILLLEIGAREAHGYEAQTGKPICFGEPSPEFREMLDVCLEAYAAVTSVLGPGCDAARIREAGSVIHERGYSIVAPLVHGIFNPIDAGPFVGTSHRPDKDVVLQPGMACCVEIHPCSADATRGVFLGDTYVITDDGARSVNRLPAEVTVL
jgi:Xaa-Pro aminopeptidase